MAVLTRSRAFVAWLLGIGALALAIRVAFVVGVDPQVPRLSDANAYHLLANNLADGHGFIRPFDFQDFGLVHVTAEYPPLFTAVLSVVSFAGGKGIEAQRLFTCLIGTGTVVMIGLLGRRVAGKAVGIAAAVLAAVYPMLFIADGMLMAENLFAFLVASALVAAYWAYDRPSPLRFAALGAILGASALTRTEGLVLAVLLIVPLVFRLRDQTTGRRVVLGIVGLAMAVLVVAPWTIRNAVEFDQLVPVSNNVGSALDGANCPPVYSGSEIGLWKPTLHGIKGLARDECFEGFDIHRRNFNEAVESARHRDDGLRYAEDHLGQVPAVLAVRVLRTFGLFHVDQQLDTEAFFEGRPRDWLTAGLVMSWILLPFAIAGAVLLARRRTPIWPLMAPFVSVVIGAMLTYGNQRFRMASEPALVVLAAVALVALARRLRPGEPSGDQAPAAAGPTNTAAG